MFSGERYVYKFMCEPDVLFSMAAHQHTDVLNTEYVQKFREDTWSEYGSHYTPEMVTFYNGVHFSRYFGYKEEQASKDATGKINSNQFLPYAAGRYFEKTSNQSVTDLRCSNCNCAGGNFAEKLNANDGEYIPATPVNEYDSKKDNYNKFFSNERYVIRSN